MNLLSKGEIEAAMQKLTSAAEILESREPDSIGDVWVGLAEGHLAQGEHEKALQTAEAAVKEFERMGSYKLADGRFTYAKVYWAMGNKEEALTWAGLARQSFHEMGLAHRVTAVDEFIDTVHAKEAR